MSALYIHVPFCLSKCGYCAFYSRVPCKDDIALYLNQLRKEAKERILHGTKEYETIFIGGGNPSALGLAGIEQIIEIIGENIDLRGVSEFTIETNPETLSVEIIDFLAQVYNIRISMGVQRLQDNELKILSRNTLMNSVYNALDNVFNKIKNVSCDFILGVPGCNTIAQDLSSFLTKYPLMHVSAYFLGVEENTPLHDAVLNKKIADPDEIGPAEMFDVKNVLADAGFTHYEISNYAKPGFECKHNLNYWLAGSYLGLGPSAVSFDNSFRISNVANLQEWLDKLAPIYEKLSVTDLRNEYIMLHLRLLELGLDIADLERNYGIQNAEFYETINKHAEKGYIDISGSKIKLSAKVLGFADSIISDYFSL